MRLTSTPMNRSITSAVALAGVLVLGGCSGGGDGAAETSNDTSSSTAVGDDTTAGGDAASATIDTETLPDPVAEVNGVPISRDEFADFFEQQRTAAQQQVMVGGPAVDEVALRDDVLDSLVSSALLVQEGERLGVEVTDADREAQLAEVAEDSGATSSEAMLELLASQGVDEDQVNEELTRLVIIDKVLAEHGGVEAPTEDELRAYYDELSGGGAADSTPAFEDVRDQVEQALLQERENAAISTLLEELRADAEITNHLS